MASGGGLQVLRNILWHSSEKVLRMFTGLFVGLWLARYLGPAQFGQFNYLLAWLGMFNAIAWLGVGETVMRDLIRHREDEGTILGSALLIRLTGSILAVCSALLAGHWFGHFNADQLILLAILALGVPFAEIPAGIWMWFASHTNIGPAVIGKNLSMVLGAVARVAVILLGLGLHALTAAVAFESVMLCFNLFVAYRLHGQRVTSWHLNPQHAWRMLRTGLPIILGSLVISLNAKLDQLLLGRLTDMETVGIYSAALRFSEIWWVVPPMIVQTLASRYIFPVAPGEQLRSNLARIVAGMGLLALIPCLLLATGGQTLITLILGQQYQHAGTVLIIHIWIAVLIFIDAPINQYLLATDRQSYLIHKSLVLLALNGLLALLLIPDYGAQGAAWAVLIAQATTVFALPLCLQKYRDLVSIYARAGKEIPWLIRTMVTQARKLSTQTAKPHDHDD